MLALRNSDTPGQRTNPAHRTGVTVSAYNGRTRKRNPQFRTNDVHDSLTRIADIENGNPRPCRLRAKRFYEFLAPGEQRLIRAPGMSVDDVIHRRVDGSGIEHGTSGRRHTLQHSAASTLVEKYSIDQ
jgi:hypothetical protein